MNRLPKYILFVFFLIIAVNRQFSASAEEAEIDPIAARPVMEYESAKLRDPFKAYLIKGEPSQAPRENADLANPEFDLSKLKVQGIIWGGRAPQAIINDQVLSIGDFIEGAKILSIEKKGITLSFNGAVLDLNAPGQNSVQAEVK